MIFRPSLQLLHIRDSPLYSLVAFASTRKAPAISTMSVRLSACISAVPAGWICVEFHIGEFDENLLRNCKFFFFKSGNNFGNFARRPKYVFFGAE